MSEREKAKVVVKKELEIEGKTFYENSDIAFSYRGEEYMGDIEYIVERERILIVDLWQPVREKKVFEIDEIEKVSYVYCD